LNPPRHPPLFYLITNRQAFRRKPDVEDNESWRHQIEAIRLAAQSGVQLIQIREKDLSARALAEFTCQAIAAARPFGAKVLVNDRLDVALATQADGVHLRVTSLVASDVRKITNNVTTSSFLIGVSTHSLNEAEAAERAGADFIVCGPVYDTPSKREYGSAMGLGRFAEICRVTKLPVLALGGINLSNCREPLQHGAAGIAAISLFTSSDSLQRVTSMLSGY
jgi:thiamine-phosphate pyrophosphorylase